MMSSHDISRVQVLAMFYIGEEAFLNDYIFFDIPSFTTFMWSMTKYMDLNPPFIPNMTDPDLHTMAVLARHAILDRISRHPWVSEHNVIDHGVGFPSINLFPSDGFEGIPNPESQNPQNITSYREAMVALVDKFIPPSPRPARRLRFTLNRRNNNTYNHEWWSHLIRGRRGLLSGDGALLRGDVRIEVVTIKFHFPPDRAVFRWPLFNDVDHLVFEGTHRDGSPFTDILASQEGEDLPYSCFREGVRSVTFKDGMTLASPNILPPGLTIVGG